MNNDAIDTPNTLPVPTNPAKKSASAVWPVLLLIIVIAAIAGGVYLWQQLHRVIYQQQNELTDLQTKIRELQTQLQTADVQLNTHTQQFVDSTARMDVLQDAAQKAMELSSRQQRGWILAEIDYLLRMANRRLQISRDIPGAIAALQGADQRLHDLADISLLPLRKQLAKDIGTLKAIRQPDVDGIALAIDQMIAHAAELPFKAVTDEVKEQLPNKEVTAPDTTTQRPGFLDSVIDTIMSVGDIKVHQRGVQPVTSSQQQLQMEQRLLTHLAGARLAALRQDATQFQRDISQAIQILQRYYDPNDNRVAQMLADLKNYSSLDLLPALPDISAAWNMLNGGGSKK